MKEKKVQVKTGKAIKDYNAEKGYVFFSKENVRFFGTKIIKVFKGGVFVTYEDTLGDYFVRRITVEGNIKRYPVDVSNREEALEKALEIASEYTDYTLSE